MTADLPQRLHDISTKPHFLSSSHLPNKTPSNTALSALTISALRFFNSTNPLSSLSSESCLNQLRVQLISTTQRKPKQGCYTHSYLDHLIRALLEQIEPLPRAFFLQVAALFDASLVRARRYVL